MASVHNKNHHAGDDSHRSMVRNVELPRPDERTLARRGIQTRLMARELPTGIARTATGYRTWVWAGGRNHSKRWKADATVTEMRDWREDQRVEARKPTPIAEQSVVQI